MIGKLFFLIFMCGIGLSSQDANDYIDSVITNNLPKALFKADLNPASISDFSTKFGTQDVYGNQGEANYTRGNLTHLDKVKRKGDCAGPITILKDLVSINCTLRLNTLISEYKVIVKNGSHVYQPRNMGHVSETLVSLEILGHPPYYRGSLKHLKVDQIGSITPTYSGLPASLNVYLNTLQDAYRKHVTKEIDNILQKNYAQAFNDALRNVSMSTTNY